MYLCLQIPLPRPGFYPLTLTEFSACVPASACLGVDSSAVRGLLQQLMSPSASPGDLQALLWSFLHTSSNIVGNHTVSAVGGGGVRAVRAVRAVGLVSG